MTRVSIYQCSATLTHYFIVGHWNLKGWILLIVHIKHMFKCMLLIMLALFVVTIPVFAEQSIMPVGDIKPGMKGIGKTVVQGTRIESFDVEVLSILKQKGPVGDLILVRVSGDVIDRTGGIASGMSGSPVYIDGKLVGAIAYGWALTDRRVGMVTPIQDMVKLWDLNGDKSASPPPSADLQPITTPLMISGLGQKALEKLGENLKPFHLVPMLSGSHEESEGPKVELEPGSAVGVQLMRGDIDMTAIGTVTYRDGDKIVGFGHPFMRRGNVGYLMSTAYIHQTIPSLDNSFKLGTSLDLVGTINQDRGSGIGGVIGMYPRVVPLRVHVKDKDTGQEKDLFVQAVQDEQLAPALLTTAALQAIEQTLDRTGMGTSWVKIEIIGKNLPQESISRENMFFHPTDIGSGSLGELLEGLARVLNNPFTPVEIMDVKLDITVEKTAKIAQIERAAALKVIAKPGETVPVTVTLKPYRGNSFTKTIDVKIPEHQAAGALFVSIRGGGSLPPLQKLMAQLGGQELDAEQPKDLEGFLKEFLQRERHNELVAEILPFGMEEDPAALLGGDIPLTSTKKPRTNNAVNKSKMKVPGGYVKPQDAPSKITTDYIIDGSAQVYIQVQGESATPKKKR
jgi:hypothetical protein